ncbi:transposase [Solwaraspora sp. WMMA2065]|uniref:RNA-guided endonuclease InsQ/TnpB family protein n=1 Tax=Solwaraspora sp. WMMA2065 TaxID=3015166 RepID=UPI00259BAB19|nr:transposase [Solwaraspora sp. WMMA2065]WJK34514.1 transposase [Solwaraspora sp. WMMA2065]
MSGWSATWPLAARTEAWTLRRERVTYNATSAMLTGWKKTDDLAFLNEVSTVTVSQDPAGRWFVSLLCDDRIEPAPATTAVVGVDAGLDSLFTLSTGEKIPDPGHERRDRRRLARAQRNLARKARGSANRAKARLAVARVHARVADRRRDHLHKLTTRLVRETQTIVIEDLAVRNMMANHRLARAVSDAGWRQFRSMLGYRADWYGRDLVVVDRWFPSTRLCSGCGVLAEHLPLAVRSWTCRCGQAHDRDVNAARNILAEGLSVIACGGGVRPHRESSSRTGRSSVKQEPPGATQGIPVPSGRGGLSRSAMVRAVRCPEDSGQGARRCR